DRFIQFDAEAGRVRDGGVAIDDSDRVARQVLAEGRILHAVFEERASGTVASSAREAAMLMSVVKEWLTTSRPRSKAAKAIFFASVSPPTRVTSICTTSILPRSISSRYEWRLLSASPAAMRSELACASCA